MLEALRSIFEEDYPLEDNLNYDENGYIYFTEPENGASRTAQVAYELYTDLIGILFPDGPFSDYFPEIPLI